MSVTKEQEQEEEAKNHQSIVCFDQGNRIYQVTDGLRSKHTRKAYQIAFNQFLKDGAKIKTSDLQVLLDHKPRVLEQITHLMTKSTHIWIRLMT